jgi:hypothetical protein
MRINAKDILKKRGQGGMEYRDVAYGRERKNKQLDKAIYASIRETVEAYNLARMIAPRSPKTAQLLQAMHILESLVEGG